MAKGREKVIAAANVQVGMDSAKLNDGLEDSKKKAKSWMQSMKQSLGEESGLGNFAKMLKGAGAIAGLTVIGQELNKVTAKALELSKEFNAGKISAGDLTEELLKSLPIYGQIWQAGRNIREIWKGEQAETDRINESAKAINVNLDLTKRILTDIKTITKEWNDAHNKMVVDTMIAGAEGPYKTWLQDQQSFSDRQDALTKKMKADGQKVLSDEDQKKKNDRLNTLNFDIAAMRAELARTPKEASAAFLPEGYSNGEGTGEREALSNKISAAIQEASTIRDALDSAGKGKQSLTREYNKQTVDNMKRLGVDLMNVGKEFSKEFKENYWDKGVEAQKKANEKTKEENKKKKELKKEWMKIEEDAVKDYSIRFKETQKLKDSLRTPQQEMSDYANDINSRVSMFGGLTQKQANDLIKKKAAELYKSDNKAAEYMGRDSTMSIYRQNDPAKEAINKLVKNTEDSTKATTGLMTFLEKNASFLGLISSDK